MVARQDMAAGQAAGRINLDDLIQRIKTEGVEEAKRKADEIIGEARRAADEIIEAARGDAARLMKDAGGEIEKHDAASRKALTHAARDAVINIRASIMEMFEKTARHRCAEALSGPWLETLLLKLVDIWKTDKDDDRWTARIDLYLNERDRAALMDGFSDAFKAEIKRGLVIKVHQDIAAGLRIGVKDKGVFYDFTDEAIAEALCAYLGPRFEDMLKNK
jgi:V/A-type H+-transporting ATPase subunit E